jgi:hypothetical protein
MHVRPHQPSMKKLKPATKSDVLKLLKDPRIVKMEKEVSKQVRLGISDPAPEVTVPSNMRELNFAGLGLEQVEQMLSEHAAVATAFSIALFKAERNIPHEEDFNPAEGDQQEDSYVESDGGLCRGFSITHLCWFSFLLSGRDADLLEYLKNTRVPKRERYMRRLKAYFKQALTAK